MNRRIRQSSAMLLLALAACGGGGGVSPNPPPPPPPPPAPVATVTVSPPSANLVPPQTQALAATTLDASGNTLTGRTVTWSTSAAAVVTVSSAGLVTAVGGGTASITATSEGKTGSATISVADGAVVGTTGGTVDAAGGAVKVTIPAGAVAAPVAITVTPTAALPTPPSSAWFTPGASYQFGPDGTTFSAPVTVTIKYDQTKIPPWAIPGDLTLYHYTAGAWVQLTGITVDPVAHAVSGKTTGFSPIVVATVIPPVALSPNPAAINFFQRSVTLTASVPGHTTLTGLTFIYTTTGKNGALNSQISPADPTIQYTYTQPALPNADLDLVDVKVRGFDPAGVLQNLGTASITVHGNIAHSFELNPQFGNTGFGQTANLDVLVREPDGSVNTAGHFKYVWSTTTFHGDLDIAGPTMVTTTRGVYTAKPIGPTTTKVPPRIDKVTVDIYERHDTVYSYVDANNNTVVKTDSGASRYNRVDGTAVAFVEVAPKVSLANFVVRTTPSPGGACVTADAIVTVVPGATSYDLTVFNIIGSPTYPSGTAHKVFAGPTNTGSILDIYSTGGGFLGVPLDGGCATSSQAITTRENRYRSQYGNSPFVVKTTP